jgi:hypothetical protein
MDQFQSRIDEARETYHSSNDPRRQGAFPLAGLLSVLDTGLKLWLSKEKTKYIDRKMSLLKEWGQEYDRADRSRLALDRIEDELNILAIAFSTAVAAGD